MISLHQAPDAPVEADIAFRALQRLSLSTAQRLEWIITKPSDPPGSQPELAEEEIFAHTEAMLGSEPEMSERRESPQRQPQPLFSLSRTADGSGHPIRWLRSALARVWTL